MTEEMDDHVPNQVKPNDYQSYGGGFYTRYKPEAYKALYAMGKDTPEFIRQAVNEKMERDGIVIEEDE